MRSALVRVLALVTAIGGTGLVVLHAGMTSGCSRHAPESQAVSPDVSNAAAPQGVSPAATAPDPGNAATPSQPRAKPVSPRDVRFMPATKSAAVFTPTDVTPQQAGPRQQGANASRGNR